MQVSSLYDKVLVSGDLHRENNGMNFTNWLAVVVVIVMMCSVTACEQRVNPVAAITVEEGLWMKQLAPGQVRGAVYGNINNTSQQDCPLVAAEAEIAERVELHQHSHDSETGMMQMRKVEDYVLVSNSLLSLQPGGYHLMLFDVAASPQLERFWLKLEFAGCGMVDVTVDIQPVNGGGK